MAGKIMPIGALISIVAYGVPALIIAFGFFSCLSGYFINGLSQDPGIMKTGFIMIILGVVFYVREFIVKIVATYYSISDDLMHYR